jgi:hypothetical protein
MLRIPTQLDFLGFRGRSDALDSKQVALRPSLTASADAILRDAHYSVPLLKLGNLTSALLVPSEAIEQLAIQLHFSR